jgi:hypothetical protein
MSARTAARHCTGAGTAGCDYRRTPPNGLPTGSTGRPFRPAPASGRAVCGLDQLLALASDQLTVMTLAQDELTFAVRLQSRLAPDREWRRSLGARSRRLDAGESASIAIAASRSRAFASDDEDALTLWRALTSTPGHRTCDILRRLVAAGAVEEDDARQAYRLLQTDDLHDLGGPPW